MKILVAGMPRSGTTFLYSMILRSVPGAYVGIFEPSPETLEKTTQFLEKQTVNVLMKVVLTSPMFAVPQPNFEKIILLIRDPRDNLVSALLYSTLHAKFAVDTVKRERFLEILRRKEREPESISVLEIIRARDAMNGDDFLAELETERNISLEFHEANPAACILSYSDLIGDNLTTVEGYLNFPLEPEVEVSPVYARVVRTKGSGDWKNWFLEEDIEFFQPHFADFIDRYRISADWELGGMKVISPEHSSLYVEKLLLERDEAEKAGESVK